VARETWSLEWASGRRDQHVLWRDIGGVRSPLDRPLLLVIIVTKGRRNSNPSGCTSRGP
jgi:hypothetical protein